MDTSEIYIKMCEGAGEIQEGWKPSVGDWYLERHDLTARDDLAHGIYFDEHLIVIGSDDDQNLGEIARTRNERDVWLPRQDQLQDMIDLPSPYHRICDKLYDFTEWVKVNATYETSDCSTEQLWLAFVMSKKFNKVWTGEEWVVSGR